MKIRLCDLANVKMPIAADAWRLDLKNSVDRAELIMLQQGGLYWLVPIEIVRESVLILEHRDKSEGNHNVLPPVTITIQQCISIPGETAKILLGL